MAAAAAVGLVVGSVLAAANENGSNPTESITSTPTTTTMEAEPDLTVATTAADSLTDAQRQAVRSAEAYLSIGGFSRLGLIAQLEFEEFTQQDATAAVDRLGVDWAEQAALSAESYLEIGGFSCQGLIDQLEFEEFTREEAEAGAHSTGIC